LKQIIIFIVRFYQATVRHIMPSACKFRPTCSEYFIEAVQKKGALRGSMLGIWRILRCNPFSKGGYDPVK
jgi:putative membrane protein insertion efficiency factor